MRITVKFAGNKKVNAYINNFIIETDQAKRRRGERRA